MNIDRDKIDLMFTYEIEHDENVTHWDDYSKCEIPPACRQAGVTDKIKL